MTDTQSPPNAALEATLANLVETVDLDRLVALARTLGGAADAMSDDIVARLAGIAGDGLALADRATRDGLGLRLPALADHVEGSGVPHALVDAVAQARKDVAAAPPVKGGVGGLISLMSRKDSQEALQFGLAVLNALKKAI